MEARTGINLIVMEQVQMLETKWKELQEEYDDDGDYSNDDDEMKNST